MPQSKREPGLDRPIPVAAPSGIAAIDGEIERLQAADRRRLAAARRKEKPAYGRGIDGAGKAILYEVPV